MIYLNIHPKRLHVVMKSPTAYSGYVVFDLEQYGVSFSSMTTPLTLLREGESLHHGWRLDIEPIDGVVVPQYTAFVESFNFYVFQLLKCKPLFEIEQELPEWNVHFEDVYFDLSGETPRMVSPSSKKTNPIKKLLKKLF